MGRVLQSAIVPVAMFCVCVVVGPSIGGAQIAAPSQLTPQSLRPDSASSNQTITSPTPSSLSAPSGAENFQVFISSVQLDGAFPEIAAQTDACIETIKGKQLSVAQIYAFAKTIERIYADAGYTLVRVTVPPQSLVDRSKLQIVVVDGFIEDVDVGGLPESIREVVMDRISSLIGRRHIKLSELERGLMIAGDIPGLKLKSTLSRGESNGGTRLVLEGEHRPVTGSLGADDRLSRALGTWQLRGAIAVNGALGFGEQIYGTIGVGANIGALIDGTSPLSVYGGGIVVPLGTDGLTINPEYTHSITRTHQALGVPATLGTFDRFALRLRSPVILNRNASLNLNSSIEYVDQKVSAPDFNVGLNSDRYGAIRFGPDYTGALPWGAGLQLGANFSQGLGGRSDHEVAVSGIPLSRNGSSPDFTKITGSARVSQQLPADMRFDLTGLVQSSFGKAMMRSEQFALDGVDAVSAYAAGTLSADQGATVRSELGRSFALGFGGVTGTATPYVFGSVGRGWLVNATILEHPVINVGALGVGARSTVAATDIFSGMSFGLELARQFTDVSNMRQGWRANVNAAVTF